MSLTKQNNYDDPLDSIEMIASLNDWTFERSGKEISIIAKGKWADYQISISWLDNFQGLSLVCGFDFRFNKSFENKILLLVSSINSRLWLGHFDIWLKEGLVLYRNTSFFEKNRTSYKYIETMINDALDSCDRFFPAFQYVLWAGKSSEEALSSVLFETKGEA